MGFEDILIGAGQGIGEGARNAGAIQDVWAKRSAMEQEKKLAPIRLQQAEQSAEMGAIQLGKAKREEEAAKAPWNPMGESFVKYMNPEQLAHYVERTKDLPKTQEGKARFMKDLSDDDKSLEIVTNISKRNAQNQIVNLDRQMQELTMRGDKAGAEKIGQQIELLTKQALDVEKSVEVIKMTRDATKIYDKLPKETQKKLEAFKDSPSQLMSMIVAEYTKDKNMTLPELALEAGKGNEDAIRAMKILAGFQAAKSGAGASNKPLQSSQLTSITAALDREYLADKKITTSIGIGKLNRSDLSLYQKLPQENQRKAYNEIHETAAYLLKGGMATSADDAVRQALGLWGKHNTNRFAPKGEAMTVGGKKVGSGDLSNQDYDTSFKGTGEFDITDPTFISSIDKVISGKEDMLDTMTQNKQTGVVTIKFTDGTSVQVPPPIKKTGGQSMEFRNGPPVSGSMTFHGDAPAGWTGLGATKPKKKYTAEDALFYGIKR